MNCISLFSIFHTSKPTSNNNIHSTLRLLFVCSFTICFVICSHSFHIEEKHPKAYRTPRISFFDLGNSNHCGWRTSKEKQCFSPKCEKHKWNCIELRQNEIRRCLEFDIAPTKYAHLQQSDRKVIRLRMVWTWLWWHNTHLRLRISVSEYPGQNHSAS